MSEYQRYEFMTIDRPLTREQLDAVDALSSHIDASSTHALIEYHWGNFKHDPIDVLHKFFDAFLYWANWGAPELAFRFPRGILPTDLLDGYDLDEFVTFTHSEQSQARYVTSTEAAHRRGVFGVPTMMIGNEMWWGAQASLPDPGPLFPLRAWTEGPRLPSTDHYVAS